LTEKSLILKENTLCQYAGWSIRSNMPQKYLHYFGNESSESILQAYGIVTKEKQDIDKLRPKNNVLIAMNQINQIASSVHNVGWY
jgi:integrase/recombinase XerD